MTTILLALLLQDPQVILEHFTQRGEINEAAFASKKEATLRVALGDPQNTETLDAIAVGYDDLAAAKRVRDGRFVCTNVPEAGERFLIRKIGSTRVGFVAVTQVPSYTKVETPGWTIRDPAAALNEVLPEVGKQADLVVLLAVMDRLECGQLLRQVSGIHYAMVPAFGTSDPEPVRVGSTVLVQTPVGVSVVGRLKTGKTPKNEFLPVELTPKEREQVRGFLGSGPIFSEAKGSPAEERRLASRNRSVETTIRGLVETNEIAGRKAPTGETWLRIDMEWKNVIPMTWVFDRQLPTAYHVANLGDHLYLVVNGDHLSRMDLEATSGPGGLLEGGFELPKRGSVKRGHAVFSVPTTGVESLELRYYDFAHGHMVFPIRGKAAAPPKVAVERNEIVEMGVFGVKKEKGHAGTTLLTVDLRARSLFTTEADASAFDPKAGKDEKIEVGTVADWQETRKHLHVVVDGEYAYAPEPRSPLPEHPRFLPDVLTGGTALFAIPEKASSIELRCDFPNAATPAGETIHPAAIVFVLEGTRPEPPERQVIAEIDDEIFHVSVVGRNLVAEFAGEKAGEGRRFLVLDVTVRNAGEGIEYFQTKEQLKVADAGPDRVTFAGPRRPGELVSIPAGERRSFQVVFRIPETETHPRLSYAGVSKAEVIELSGEPKRACPKCKEPAAADDRFCEHCGAKIDPR